MATAASAPAVTDVARERDVYGLSGDVKKDLLDYLDNIASSGDFATMKSMPNLSVDPDVRLLGKGDQEDCKIEAPLGLQDAQKLINATRQAPFGKGERTIVDTTFRNTWELDPSQFSLSKNWQSYVDSLMRSACDGLGVKTNDVRAELYKMLLYEKGAMFKPHADSEKTSEVVPAERIAVMLAYLQKRVQNTPEQKSEELKRSVYRACELVAARNNNPGHYAYGGEKPTYTDEMVLEAFKTCMALGLRVPLPALATAFKKELPEFALQSLRRLTTEVGFEEIKPIYDNLVRKQQGVSARFKTLLFLAGADPLTLDAQSDIVPEIRTWAQESLEDIFSDFGSLSDNDARELARFVADDSSGLLLKDRIVPRLYEILDTPTPEKTAFIMSFLSRIYEHFRSTGSARTDIPDIYSPEEEIREPALNGHDLALIFQHCRELGLEECINQMIGRILEEIDTMDMKDFLTSILPLLEDLLSDIKKGEVNAERFKRLFQTGLAKYIVTYVSDEPKQLNWSREPTKCNGDYRGYFPGHGATKPKAGTCQDCQQMNVFLQSPTETVWRFPAAEARRKHLISKLSDKHECFTTIEKPRTPFSLVVTKHKRSMDEKHRKWKARVSEVKGHLQSLEGRHRILDNVLQERYADIMAVRVKNLRGETGQAVEGSNDRSEHTQAGPPQVAGQKRKAAVVDLTVEQHNIWRT
ncbi:hypothetical protein D6C83_03620 [Aureobasidium pullulans]|uniref:Uncharacterized protein n=1 Tax=Aureobasidium pullulans TaxID=5580 RepID=A0A4T0DHW1_AURPU|nr:hypothetical protein D6C83_03620 [Aureobasidium pullulans]